MAFYSLTKNDAIPAGRCGAVAMSQETDDDKY